MGRARAEAAALIRHGDLSRADIARVFGIDRSERPALIPSASTLAPDQEQSDTASTPNDAPEPHDDQAQHGM